MIDMESRLAKVARTWIDEQASSLDRHPDAATWARYRAGDLPAGEIEALRDHLVTCRACRKLVLADPKAGATRVADSDAAAADAEQQAAWQKARRTFEEMSPPVPAPPPASGRGWITWASPLVAVLALAIAGWTGYQANQPRLGVVIAEAVPAGGSRGAAQGGAQGEGRPLALLLPLPGLPAGTPVRVEILDGAGAVSWQGEGTTTTNGEYGLEIPARFRRPDGCQVRVSAPAEAEGKREWKPLGTFVVNSP